MMRSRAEGMHVILALTEIWRRTGGIPAFNKVLVDEGARLFSNLTVVSLNDRPGDLHGAHLHDHSVVLCRGQRWRFVRSVVVAVVRSRRPVLLLGHTSLAPIGLFLRLLRPGFRYAVVAHGVEAWSRGSWLRRASLTRATRIAVVSRFTAEQLMKFSGVRRCRISLLRNVVPPPLLAREEQRDDANARSSSITDRAEASDGPVLLTTGRLDSSEQYKGHDRVMRALPQIVSRYPDVRYVIVGEGDDVPRLARFADEIGLSDRVCFTGLVGVEELDSHYRKCDVFVMPSTGEGFGIVFLEAMFHGKPVVAGNKDGSAEPVVHGRTGWLVDPDNIDELAAAIIDLLAEPARRDAFGAAGRARVLSEFTVVHFRDDLRALLDEVTR